MASTFIDYMGYSPTVRVLDYLMTERDMDFSISDLARNVGLGRSTLYRIWDKLLKNKMLVHTREIGMAKLYKLNKNNFVVKKLLEIDNALMIKKLKSKRIKVTV